MAIRERLAAALAQALLGGSWTSETMRHRADSVFRLAADRNWLDRLIEHTLIRFPDSSPRPIERALRTYLQEHAIIPKPERVDGTTRLKQRLPHWGSAMWPATGPPSQWTVPGIVSVPGLAEWLSIDVGSLEWFADRIGWSQTSDRESLRHYRYRWIKKPSGGLRLLETPKPRLKQLQRKILREILNLIPVSSAAQAFCAGRSIATHVTPHAGRRALLHIDLREFFPSIQASRVNAAFRTMGYPEQIAGLLTGLCTNSTPSHELEVGCRRLKDEATWLRFRIPHLPQGAPTSPCLANLCAFRLDRRLTGLAREVSAQYTRYADDLVFSGDREFQRCLPRLRILIQAIILDEGFEIRHRKTRVMTAGNRQQVSGIRLNEHANIPRETFDELKAILHNCRRFGPASQNRSSHPRFREHLAGRLAYWASICPERIVKLKTMFDEIEWV